MNIYKCICIIKILEYHIKGTLNRNNNLALKHKYY